MTKGNLVNAGGGDTLLTTIVSVDPIYVYFDVDERSLRLYRQRCVRREVGAGPARTVATSRCSWAWSPTATASRAEGVIDFAENRLNPATGTIRVARRLPQQGRPR